jgi:DNA-binding response OmpR family regulator
MNRSETHPQASGSRLPTAARPRLEGLRVLVVEDEALIAMELAAVLEEEGAEVVGPCDSIDLALALIGQALVTAAILDMRVGRDSIEPVARALAERKTPFLFYSGQLLPEALRHISANAPLISKPALGRALVEALAELCRATPPRRPPGRRPRSRG